MVLVNCSFFKTLSFSRIIYAFVSVFLSFVHVFFFWLPSAWLLLFPSTPISATIPYFFYKKWDLVELSFISIGGARGGPSGLRRSPYKSKVSHRCGFDSRSYHMWERGFSFPLALTGWLGVSIMWPSGMHC